ncbi:Uncharacterised protein [Mycobacteroides abscessus subsp. massiliense]|nr:Uncharacterised protein [Mycobacteroides abscessus subsp. massiliense]
MLVGSSSSSSCGAGSASSTAASVARNRSPPESAPTSLSAALPRNRNRASLARTALTSACGARRATLSATLSESSSRSRRCGRSPSGTCTVAEPSAAGMRPAMVCSRVVLPEPLGPTRPTRCGPRRSRCAGTPWRSTSCSVVSTTRPAGTSVPGRSIRMERSARRRVCASSKFSRALSSRSVCVCLSAAADSCAARLRSPMTILGSRLLACILAP